jgi:hypothetical protein
MVEGGGPPSNNLLIPIDIKDATIDPPSGARESNAGPVRIGEQSSVKEDKGVAEDEI